MSELPDLKPSMLFRSIIEPCLLWVHVDVGVQNHMLPPRQIGILTWLWTSGHRANETDFGWQNATISWSISGLAELHTVLPASMGYKYSIAHYLIFDNQMHTTLSLLGQIIRERVGTEFCIYYSCLLENKEEAMTLVLFQACNFRDMRDCTKCCWGTSDPFGKEQELPSPQSLFEHGWSSMNS